MGTTWRSASDMQPEKSCDYNDHDHYADDVENIHFFAPIEEPLALVQQRWCVLVPVKSFSTVARSRTDWSV
jgi:hypothetical protein